MRAILERVSAASVEVDGAMVAQIAVGYLVLVGFTHTDTESQTAKMAEKIANLRIMPDENDKMNLTIGDQQGQVLAVPQFTLYADTSGRRPGFKEAAPPDLAKTLFDSFVAQLIARNVSVATGVFGAHMSVTSKNDGPLTLQLEV